MPIPPSAAHTPNMPVASINKGNSDASRGYSSMMTQKVKHTIARPANMDRQLPRKIPRRMLKGRTLLVLSGGQND